MSYIQKTVVLPDGKELHIETGRLARQADGAAVITCGETKILATVVGGKKINVELDFLPLSVDYVEKYASSGKIPGGFFKREGRLGENEILVSRLVDRALRPLFPSDYHGDVQVIIQLISADREEQADGLACFAAAAAIAVSDLPFPDLVSEIRVIRKDGKLIASPTVQQMEGADIDLLVAATTDSIMMVEGEMNEVSEEEMLEAIKYAHEGCKAMVKGLDELRAEVGKATREYDVLEIHPEIDEYIKNAVSGPFLEVTKSFAPKGERSAAFDELYKKVTEALTEKFGEDGDVKFLDTQIKVLFKKYQKKVVRTFCLDENKRLDGRAPDEVRDIWSEVSYLPRAHGSALFTRGETQSLCTVTLGSKMDEQMIDRATEEGTKRFLLHYNFPPFSTGEARFMRGPGRREIGHGNLAERSLKMVVPKDYDYTVRIVSDILESNGSSSMASVCGGSLALMDAGVPIKGSVSGIAMGLITDGDTFVVLSDILGDEDFLGDMDFKVAGTKEGLTACQMDIKIRGLSYEIMGQALEQSKGGRSHIREKMEETLSTSKVELSRYAPRLEKLIIPGDMIGAVIGPGGKIIQEIQKTTGTTVVLEEVDNKGHVTISSPNLESIEAAKKMIQNIVKVPEVGEIYDSKVVSIKDFGAFVEILPGKEGLLHISEIEHKRLDSMEGVFKIGEIVKIKIVDIDQRSGKFKLSRKVLIPKPEGFVEEERPRRREGGPRPPRRGADGRPNRRPEGPTKD